MEHFFKFLLPMTTTQKDATLADPFGSAIFTEKTEVAMQHFVIAVKQSLQLLLDCQWTNHGRLVGEIYPTVSQTLVGYFCDAFAP